VTGVKYWNNYPELCNAFSGILSTDKVPRVDRDYVADDILHCGFFIPDMINLFMFVRNWDILTLLVMRDIIYFILVTSCGVNIMYGVIFVLVADLVVCIYVIYL